MELKKEKKLLTQTGSPAVGSAYVVVGGLGPRIPEGRILYAAQQMRQSNSSCVRAADLISPWFASYLCLVSPLLGSPLFLFLPQYTSHGIQ